MNQDQAKEKLCELGVSTVDFTVIFSGKASMKVNGLYKYVTREIIIHNRNFTNDNMLMFTAIHELVHHIAMTRGLIKTRTAHPVAFWALFHSLLEIAMEMGIYTDPFPVDPELKAQGVVIMGILREQLEIQRRLGAELVTMEGLCTEKGARYEDYLDRHARIPRAEAAAVRAYFELFEDLDASSQVISLVSGLHGDARSEAELMAAEGKSIAQIRAAVKQQLVIDPRKDPGEEKTPEEELRSLEKKLARMRASKESLGYEIGELEKQIDQIKGQYHLEFEKVGAA